MKKVFLVCGARPNFMKIAPIMQALKESGKLLPYLVHTGQHYDEKMSKSFFDLLRIPKPDVDLEVGSGSHAEQTGKVMVEFEKVCLREKPDIVVVVGDVNSTMACTIAAKKLYIPVAHVEAGLRSFDMRMPEEINRIVTDSLCDLYFITDPDGEVNLLRSGTDPKTIFFAGNVMVDTLLSNKEIAAKNPILQDLGVRPGQYALLTLHRPSNVDDPAVLADLLSAFAKIQEQIPIVFPSHPRTLKMLEQFGLMEKFKSLKNLVVRGPTDYHQTLCLSMHARLVLTDSGGLQEETTVLGVPCITLRENTERPVTAVTGTNEVVGTNPARILDAVDRVLAGKWKKGGIPQGWDGHAGRRIVEELEVYLRV